MEREKIEEEYQELMHLISGLREIIENEHILLGLIKKEILELKDSWRSKKNHYYRCRR